MLGRNGSATTQIPRIIWMLWFDGWDQAPELHRRCMESWQLYNLDWEVRPISRLELPQLLGDFTPRYEELRRNMNVLEDYGDIWIPPAAESDLLRLILLKSFGGCWVDSTMLCRRPLADWLPSATEHGFFAFSPESHEEKLHVMSSFIASAPGNTVVTAWLERTVQHWSTPRARRKDLGFFWVHHLFAQLVGVNGELAEDDAAIAARAAWEQVPRISGEYGVRGPHFWVKYNDKIRPRPTLEHQAIIDNDRETPMYKLTNHEVKLTDVGPESCYWILLEDTRLHSRARARAAVGKVSGFAPGAGVRLRDLSARPELNGQEGILVAFNEDKGRWQVQLKDGFGNKLFKEQNLEPLAVALGAELALLSSGSSASAVRRLLENGKEVGCH